jgi:N6-L-threonylcarbamoyladenine synthase
MREWFAYELIGRTKDDAVGEAFDKVARMIGLDYPGGPKVEAHAAASKARGSPHTIVFPRPLAHEASCDFSFSGLKTAVLYKLRTIPESEFTQETKEHIAEAFQDAARDVLILKTRRALRETSAKTLAVGGGVSASKEIRRALEDLVHTEFPDVRLAYPAGALHLDNAIMIGMAAYLRQSAGKTLTGDIIARGSQTIVGR